MIRLFWIDLHYACCGFETTDGTVTLAAPDNILDERQDFGGDKSMVVG
jgi:hypothetical protein